MLSNKKIIIGITGGIAAYRICSLINKLKKEGADIKVIMTEAATKFVTPVTFQSLTNHSVHTSTFDTINKSDVEHIKLADWCDLFLLAPATYNTINKIAFGIADNLLTTVICALPKATPVLIAPAMNCHMWENPIMKSSIERLENINVGGSIPKYSFVGPQKGKLVCGYEGEGVLEKNEEIIKRIDELMKK
ncbi:MAG: flavoprotein [Patescibacteria group bacterium]|jgi:phosphopantothenoylcysteine decarboxylase/phosphopantothenate--cysteine ligase